MFLCRNRARYKLIELIHTITILGLIRIVVVMKTVRGCVTVLHKLLTLVILQTIVDKLYVTDKVVVIRCLVIKMTNTNTHIISHIENSQ